ncbi:MAG: hypothetical protein AB1607_13430 [Chloroflexota bacterium]
MDKQGQKTITASNVGKILIWLGLLLFFIYSLKTTVNWENIANHRRYSQATRILTALAQPNFFEYEYETRETTVILENDCLNPNNSAQVEQMSDSVVEFDLDCTTARRPTYTIRGTGFQPNTTGYIVWYPESTFQLWANTPFAVDHGGSFLVTDFPFSAETIVSGHTIVVVEQLSKTFRDLSETSYDTVKKMWETIQIAFLATCISAMLAIPFTILIARTSSPWGRGFNILLQPILAAVRSIHPLITVIPAIVLLGIGPTGGVLAITLFSTAVLITKFSEYAEQHVSLNWATLLTVHFPTLAFRQFTVNIVIATVIGFMGGGGIGFILQQSINLLNYRDASVAIIAIIVSVGSLDLLSRIVWLKIQKEK